jgi:vancomycin resistance protein YoaR
MSDSEGTPGWSSQPAPEGAAPQTGPATPPRRRRWPWITLGVLVLVLAGGYVAAYALIGDRVPHGTTVAGVDIGGMEPDQAQATLERELADRAARPVTFEYDGQTYPIDPEAAGLSFDAHQTVLDAGGGRSWNPVRMIEVLTGPESDVDPVLHSDDEALQQQVAAIAAAVDAEATEGAISMHDTRARVTEPVVGVRVDRAAAVEAVDQSYFEDGDRAIELPVDEQQPDVTSAELEDFVSTQVAAIVERPIQLVLPGQTLALSPKHFAPALSWSVDDGDLALSVDKAVLDRTTRPVLALIDAKPRNASLVLRNGRPVVIPARPGVTVTATEIADAVHQVAEDPSKRRVRVGTTVAQADVTTRDLNRLGVKEKVSDFVTYFPYAEYRNINQGRAAELIDGTLIRPGQTFSFNGTVGERTRENGFTEGFIISDGVFREELGGGVSQVVTTTYNAAFFAGMDDVTHTPHSFYIDRYPLGREATVAWPSVDLKFRNSTPYGVMIHAWVVPSTVSTAGEMHVQMFSTKYWNITAGVSDRYNFRSPSTRYDPSNRCVANTGYSGFDVDVYRYFRKPGSSELVKKETTHVAYTPSDTVICSAPPGG